MEIIPECIKADSINTMILPHTKKLIFSILYSTNFWKDHSSETNYYIDFSISEIRVILFFYLKRLSIFRDGSKFSKYPGWGA